MNWYEIKASAQGAEVMIYDEIGAFGISAKQFADDIKKLGDIKHMTVRLNSPGGSVIDGNAIYTTLKNHKAKVTVHIDSVALSMGSVIAMAGDHVAMAQNGLMMIHNPWGGAIGDADELRKTADVMDKMKSTLVRIYTTKTGMSEEAINDMMNEETWMDADEALQFGFIDEITGAVDMAANFDLSAFRNVPERLTQSAVADTQPQEVKHMTAKVDDKATEPVEKPSVDVDKIAAKAAEDALAKERARRSDIRKVFDMHGGRHRDLMDSCLDDGNVDVNAARKLLLDEIGKDREPIAGDARIESPVDARDKFRAAAIDAIEMRAGKKAHDGTNEFRGFTLLEMAKKSLDIANVSTRGMDKMRVVGAAFTHTSSDFPYLLENSLGKELQRAYGEFAETWSQIAATSSVPDFKQNSRIRLGSFNSLDTIPEAGEYTSGTFSEERETIQAATKGKMISLTRQMIINDDLGGFMRIAAMMGRAAARTVGNDVYSVINTNGLMSDGVALFASGHSNLEGTPSAPTAATVGAARAAMRKQQDLDGNDYLDIRPSIFLVPVALEDTANVLVASETDPSKTNSKVPNPVRGFAQVVSDPRLDATSTTAWYLLADPSMYPTVEVAFLDGNQAPYLESENGFTVDGTRWKVRLDYGVAAVDFRSAYKNAGA